ncbi:hypothetical protein TRFO_14250 [Tritrichomonas foetus]|uniref:Uncharacterized protein n=1 Tax=Tritrichomonas foetus TaxID=1144522 RepID=A0A1J4KZV7_9EUKA|nr:hypothetical protein TRFO_14250 [Tritrichomonas foetus]|eukprot:OHT15228.1 hypothetical protein TRFO_14250 [Tritrichomonas foetus]
MVTFNEFLILNGSCIEFVRNMNQQIAEDYKRATTSMTNAEQLRIEREFRFFLLHLLDTSNDNIDIINAVAPLYHSEISKIKGASQAKKDKEFEKILKLLMNGEEPINIGVELSPDERKNVLISLLDDQKLSSLRSQILKLDIPVPLFRSLAHTFAYYSNLAKENESLEKRLQSLRDVRHFSPNSEDVFIPTKPTSSLSTPRGVKHGINTGGKKSSVSNLPLSQQSSSLSSSRPNSELGSTPATPRISSSSSRLSSSRMQTTKFRSPSKIDTETVDFENQTLRKQIEMKEHEIKQTTAQAKMMKAAIEKRIRDIAYIQKEILSLEDQLEGIKKEEKQEEKIKIALDESSKDMILKKKREANEITTQQQKAIEENRRLKERAARENI